VELAGVIEAADAIIDGIISSVTLLAKSITAKIKIISILKIPRNFT
jgi:hypothetical protein